MRRKCSRRQRPWQQPLPPADKACTVWCKFALEAYADCLRQELAPHGMAVSIVQPGAVATDIGDNGHAGSVRRLQATDPPFADAAAVVLQALFDATPQTRYLVGTRWEGDRVTTVLSGRLLDAGPSPAGTTPPACSCPGPTRSAALATAHPAR